jgi:Protein of unknown function (DUF982)
MQQVIDVNFHVTWERPVYIRIGGGSGERIDGPDAALSVLSNRWPLPQSSELETAKRLCLAAITRHGSTALARRSFVDAAVAVKVFA